MDGAQTELLTDEGDAAFVDFPLFREQFEFANLEEFGQLDVLL
jgi:hypothetical protein